jgi:glutamate-1-semialdehyde 2,1-aminomutase
MNANSAVAASRSLTLYQAARQIIPGGTQLLSKRPEMFAPEQWPAYFAEARGCEVVDLDGRTYLDFTHNGVGACLLGYAHPRVVQAAVERVQRGSACSLNCPDEVFLAQKLIEMHPWAEQARFARCGGEALSVAVRIARAATHRDVIAFCGYHGWCDWYLAANLNAEQALDGHLLPGLDPAGVPRGLVGTALPFSYNRLEELAAIMRKHGSKLAAVVMEPTRNAAPASGFLEGVRELCDESGAKLIFDEVTTGFRFRLGGVHLNFSVEPDGAVFAKALGNGHPIAAIIGRRSLMEAAQETFISSTNWTEGVGPSAALATIDACRELNVAEHVCDFGDRFQSECQRLAQQHQLPLTLSGFPQLTVLRFDHPEAAALQTLLTVRMLHRGILSGSSFYPTLAHERRHLDVFLAAADEVFAELAQSLRAGDTARRIGGPIKHAGFARLT